MPRWLERIRGRSQGPEPLTGAPAVRRMKNYSSLSGYAYEYVYDGARETPDAREHVFTVSADRKNWFALTLVVRRDAIAAWEANHGRALSAAERYAIAKLALFAAFDEREGPLALRQPVIVDSDRVEVLLAGIGIE